MTSLSEFIVFAKLLSGEILSFHVDRYEPLDSLRSRISKKVMPNKHGLWKIDLYHSNEQIDLINNPDIFVHEIIQNGDTIFVLVQEPTLKIVRFPYGLYDNIRQITFTQYKLSIGYNDRSLFIMGFWFDSINGLFVEDNTDEHDDITDFSFDEDVPETDPISFFHRCIPSKIHQIFDENFVDAWNEALEP